MRIDEIQNGNLSNAEILSMVKLKSLLKLMNIRDIDKDATDLIKKKTASKLKKNKVLGMAPKIKPLDADVKLEQKEEDI